jgi:Mg/Co/Ni transporter MgtE
MAMAGNVGVQSSSIVVQSIASGVKDVGATGKRLLKELLVAFATASIFAVLIFIYNYFVAGKYQSNPFGFHFSVYCYALCIIFRNFDPVVTP